MKKIVSFFLATVMVLSLIPLGVVTAFANEPPTASISVESGSAAADSYVDIAVNISENPGIVSMGILLSFGDELTLVEATNGEAFSAMQMTPPAQLKNGGSVAGSCRFAWLGSNNCTGTGTLLNLRFYVSADATLYKDCLIAVACEDGDAINNDRTPVEVTIQNGNVTIIDYIPGDADDSGYINMLDVLALCRYYVDGCKYDPDGYAINLKAESGDVDANGKINMMDVLTVCQYYVDGCKYDPNGYKVKLLPGKRVCNHNMQHFEAILATCTEAGNLEYWHCDVCNEYFADSNGNDRITYDYTCIAALGHDTVAVEATSATHTSSGYTAGVWCERCSTWISGHEVILPIAADESNISYRHYIQRTGSDGNNEFVNDEYLSTHGIVNPNPVTYVEGVGVSELIEGVEIDGKKVEATGYSFRGWYERPEANANRIYSIPTEATGDKILYGVWSKNEYKITYLPDSASSTLPRVEDGVYTVDKETSLSEPPKWPNLVWIGWSNDEGEIVKSISKGTTGDITLTANWMSKRNQTVPNTKYASAVPAIVTDEENGIYAFTYEIGDIQNVPIQQVEDGVDGKGFNLVKGMTHEINETFTQKIGQGEATGVANTIANATTKSDSWTLSEDWNKSTEFSQEHSSEVTAEQSQKAAMAFSETNKYTLSSGVGGSNEHIDETGSSTKVTRKDEFGVSLNVAIGADLKAKVTKKTPFKNVSAKADLGLEYKHSKETEEETHEIHTDKTSSYWNLDKSFENSETLSESAEFAASLSQSVKDTYKYGETLDFGGSQSNTVSSSNTSSDSREYSSSITYSTEEGREYTVSEILTADADTGFYRKVLAANFRVFAVVIYDMNTNTFSTTTYSLKINNSEHLFTDYSTVSSFNDYENGVLPFEVPLFVSEYVYGLVGKSDGLRFDDETGVIEGYGFKDPDTGICYLKYDELTDTYSEPCDTDVIIPRYIVVTVSGNQKKIVPVTGLSASAFSNTTVTSVYLSDKITVIPDGAFKNCTSLKYVRGGTIESIGENAFKNCPSLFEFSIPSRVTSLGANAFDGVTALTIAASTAEVFDAAMVSGVKKLTIDISDLNDTIDGKKITTAADIEYFALLGGGKTVKNISIESSADSVVLNNIKIINSFEVPLQLSADNVELSFTTIESKSIIMRLAAESTIITLEGNNYFTTSGENVMLTKGVRFLEKEGSSAAGKLRVTGNILVYGTTGGMQCVSFESAAYVVKYLTDEEYLNMLNNHYVNFDANGGTVSEDSKPVVWNSEIGELPVPTREDCTFIGWFTDDGVQITADSVFTSLGDVTLKAHWTSGWVLASEIPTDGEVKSEKWTYDLTTNISSGTPSVAGYTLYNTTSEWGPYGQWSNWSRTAVSQSDSRKVETKNVTDSAGYTQYSYWRYINDAGTLAGTKGWNGCYNYQEIYLDYELGVTDASLGLYGPALYNGGFSYLKKCWFFGSSSWIPAVTHTEYRYCERSLVYTYHLTKTEQMESLTEITGSDTISNIQKWAQYTVQ